MDWKIGVFIVLMSYVTASASNTEMAWWKRYVAMMFGICATGFFSGMLLALDIQMGLL